jgi:hypothetical protein
MSYVHSTNFDLRTFKKNNNCDLRNLFELLRGMWRNGWTQTKLHG